MKSISLTYRFLAFSMALLMFFTSIGLIVDMHYCQGQFKTFKFFGKAKSCHDIGQGMKNCPHHKKLMATKKVNDHSLTKKDCCSNKTFHFQLDQDLQNQLGNTVLSNKIAQYFVLAFADAFLLSTVTETDTISYTLYRPPLIPRDIYVLLETFLL